MGEKKNCFETVCRLCVKNVKLLYKICAVDKDGITYSEKINVISGIQIRIEDNFPKMICKGCCRRLRNSYEFRNLCLSSEKLLNQYRAHSLDIEPSRNHAEPSLYFIEVEEDSLEDVDSKLELEDIEALNVIFKESFENTNESNEESSNEVKTDNCLVVTDKEATNEETIKKVDANVININPDGEVHEESESKREKKEERAVEGEADEESETKSEEKEERAICEICNKTYASSFRVKIHIKRAHQQIYLSKCNEKCPKCGKKFKEKRNLRLHMRTHNNDSYFQCNFCEKKFYGKKSWRQHIKTHAHEYNVICNICNKTISSNIAFVYHMDFHRTKQALADKTFLSCNTCNIDFELYEELEKHSLETHCLNIPSEHDYLGSVLNIKSLNRDHYFESTKINSNNFPNTEIHQEDIENIRNSVITSVTENMYVNQNYTVKDPVNSVNKGDGLKNIVSDYKLQNINASVTFRCNICCRVFKHLPDLKFHVIDCYKKYDKPKLYMCDVCGKCFPSDWILSSHKRGHSDLKPFICDTCGQAFKWHNDLTNHQKRIHAHFRPYVCKICGKRCSTTATLKAHMRAHTGEKPYVCDVCGAAFSQHSSLREHKIKHTGGEDQNCPICNKTFKTALRLRTHVKRHNTQRKLFPCDICGRQFTEKASVRKHKAKIHTHIA